MDQCVSLDLLKLSIEDTTGLEAASSAVLGAMAAGEITPSEGQALSTILESHRKVLELADIDRRLQVLEQERTNTMKLERRLEKLEQVNGPVELPWFRIVVGKGEDADAIAEAAGYVPETHNLLIRQIV